MDTMEKWENQSIVANHLASMIITEIVRDGKSETLDEILAEYCDKDDIGEIFPEAFEEGESL
jgi:hypothetical protein